MEGQGELAEGRDRWTDRQTVSHKGGAVDDTSEQQVTQADRKSHHQALGQHRQAVGDTRQ